MVLEKPLPGVLNDSNVDYSTHSKYRAEFRIVERAFSVVLTDHTDYIYGQLVNDLRDPVTIMILLMYSFHTVMFSYCCLYEHVSQFSTVI